MNPDTPDAIAIRLADEGVPMRAIARATHIPSTRLYQALVEARMQGRLLCLPRDDWPPGCPRDQRALQLSRMMTRDHDALILAVQKLFALPPRAAGLLLQLVQHERVSHEHTGVGPRVCNVYICQIRRRLAEHGLQIRTLWGYGYQLSQAHRHKAMELILTQLAPEPAANDP
jgi:hypothetical protein